VLLAFDLDGTLAPIAATSVGITARVLKDADAPRSGFARIILGAAVIDDVLGLLVLAVVSGIIKTAATGEALSAGAIALIMASVVHRDHAHDRHAPGPARFRLRRLAYLSHMRTILHPGR